MLSSYRHLFITCHPQTEQSEDTAKQEKLTHNRSGRL